MKEIMMKKNIVFITLLALIAMAGSLRAEVGPNLLDAEIFPGFEDPNLSDWTVTNTCAVVDTTSSTGDRSLFIDSQLILGVSDQGGDYADLVPVEAFTDYLVGLWAKESSPGGSTGLYFYPLDYYDNVSSFHVGGAYPLSFGTVTANWTFYPSYQTTADIAATGGMSLTNNSPASYYADDMVIAKITDAATPHVLAWGDNAVLEGIAWDLRGYVEAGTAGAISTTTWSLVSGAGGVVFSPSGDGGVTANAAVATATFDTAGTYTLRLEAVDAASNPVSVTVDYVVTEVVSAGPATDPSPADGAEGVAEGVSFDTPLGWTPGLAVETQEVYFDAGAGTPTTLVDSGDDTLSTVDNSALNGGADLDPNTVYSWQVIGYIGATPYPGPVWSFKTPVGLVYHWPLDGNLNEVVSGNNGAATGAIGYDTGADGEETSALSVTATTWATSINNIGLTGNTPRTLIGWFNVPSTTVMHSPVSTGASAVGGQIFEILVIANGFAEGHFYGGGIETGWSIPYAANTWYMAAVTYDGTTASYYQNAALSASKALALTTTDSPATIGGALWTNNYNGLVDDVRIYDYALSQSELQAVYLEVIDAAPYATNPSPVDESEHVSVDTDLGWSPGIGIDSQDVYFEAGPGTPTILLDSGDDTLSTVANSLLNGGAALDPNTVYSWQVVSYIGATPYPGPVWSFRTAVGLVYHWPLNGNLDEVISGNNGAATGTITYVPGADGDPNRAIEVSAEDFASSTNNLGITGRAQRTVNCWFKVPDHTANRVPFSSGVAVGCYELFEIYAGGSGLGNRLFGHFWCGPDTLGVTTATYPAGEWVMATLIYDGTDVSVYQNAFLIAQMPVTLSTVDSPAYIGGGGWLGYDGQVDDVRVYDTVLTQDEIAQIYLDMLPIPYVCVDPPAMDFTGDCRVRLDDLAIFLLDWLSCERMPVSTCP